MIGREVAVRDPEIPLQLDGIACRQRHHGLKPDRAGNETWAVELSPKETRISVAQFTTCRPRKRAEVLELIL